MFLPTTRKELKHLGWKQLDIILITGDAYIDSPFIGVAVIGKMLVEGGFRVGIIAQPDIKTAVDITRLGEPRLFWGVSGGSIDSLVANRTASGRKRKRDDYTPGGINNRKIPVPLFWAVLRPVCVGSPITITGQIKFENLSW